MRKLTTDELIIMVYDIRAIVMAICLVPILLAGVLTIPSCDEEKTFEDISNVLVPVLVDTYIDTRADPLYTEDTSIDLYYTHLKSNAASLGLGNLDEQRAFAWLQGNLPTVALMVYREGTLGAEGLWPRFNVWAESKGYPGASIALMFTMGEADRDELLPLALTAAAEEYQAVTGMRLEPQGLDVGSEE